MTELIIINSRSHHVGKLFLGKSFGSLTSDKTPKFVHYIDVVVHSWLMQDLMPLTFRLLRFVPIEKLQFFLEAGDGFYDVC